MQRNTHQEDIRSLRVASQSIKELEELDKDNPHIPILIKNVNDTLERMQARSLITQWLEKNQSGEYMHVRIMMEQIHSGLYDQKFWKLAKKLSYDVFRDMDDFTFGYLTILFNEAKTNNTYPSKDSPTLRRLINRLKENHRELNRLMSGEQISGR